MTELKELDVKNNRLKELPGIVYGSAHLSHSAIPHLMNVSSLLDYVSHNDM